MGEEEKKPTPTPAPAEEGDKKEETVEPEKPAEETKKEEKKSDESKGEEAPPQEIVLRVFMHCEACARKVRRCLKGFEGVEEVITDCRTSKVVVKGEKADPVKVLQRVQKKSRRQVELISPIPKPPTPPPPPPAEEPPEKEVPNPQDKNEEAEVITVVLGVYMHCEACALEIKRRIQRMKGVETADPDFKSSKVTIKGLLDPEKLCTQVYKRTGKHTKIIKIEPEKKEEPKVEEPKEEKKASEDAWKTNEETKEVASGGGEPQVKASTEPAAGGESDDPTVKKNEMMLYNNQYPGNFQMYPQRYVPEMNTYPPQMFSDENPNACFVM